MYGHHQSYRMPAPWGSLSVVLREDALCSIVPSLTKITVPERAPEAAGVWMNILENYFVQPLSVTGEILNEIYAQPRFAELSPFAQDVLRHVAQIRAGEIRTYGDVAAACGNHDAARAVGRVMASNPYPVLIPCHRVMAADDLAHVNILKPETFARGSYMGSAQLAPIAGWLRLHDMADAG